MYPANIIDLDLKIFPLSIVEYTLSYCYYLENL